jgi:hypothetical protein
LKPLFAFTKTVAFPNFKHFPVTCKHRIFLLKYFAAEPEVSSSDPKGGLHAHNKKHSKAETDPRLGVKKADASKHKKTGTFLVANRLIKQYYEQ